MRSQPTNSPQAAARLVALTLISTADSCVGHWRIDLTALATPAAH